jgi:protein-S-isoprenylcysteine O-methyltransferase Ste14
MQPSSLRIASRLALLIAALALLLFLPAGRLDWPEAWAFIVLFGVTLAFYGMRAYRQDPGQLRERGRAGPNVKPWDRWIMNLYTLLFVGVFVLCGLDARFGWSAVPGAVEAAAWLGMAAAALWILWAVTTNTFASRHARIQGDRGQTVVESGPYHFVRHPMYIGIIVFFLCLPLALGTAWGLAAGALIAALFVLRAALEDRMLRAELPGYAAYAARTRYRLVPWVW